MTVQTTKRDSQSLLADYDASLATRERFTTKVAQLVRELLAAANLSVQSVSERTKARESLAAKLTGGQRYPALTDITDLSGVRIVTYFADHVDIIGAIIEREFQVDVANSVDKRQNLDPDRFGYLSLHYVVELNESRRTLYEYRAYGGLKAEIQIRSLLQHGWAEIEHDLGYKSKVGVPSALQRRFARLAGLLEIADQEFGAIRDDLKRYELQVPDQIRNNPDDVEINKASLLAFVQAEPAVSALDVSVAESLGTVLRESIDDRIEYFAAALHALELKTIGQLKVAFHSSQNTILIFASEFRNILGGPYDRTVVRGISVLYFIYLLAGANGGAAAIEEVMTVGNIGSPGERSPWSHRIMKVVDSARGRLSAGP